MGESAGFHLCAVAVVEYNSGIMMVEYRGDSETHGIHTTTTHNSYK